MSRPPSRRTRAGARRALGLPLFLLTLVLLAPAAAALPQVSSSAYRIDLGTLAPGAQTEGGFTLLNHGPGAAYVSFVQEGDPVLAALSASVVALPENESRRVTFTYAVPANATPGNHEESVRMLVHDAPPEPQGYGGHLVAGTAVLLRSRTAAVGVVAVEGPAALLPNASLAGRVLVYNSAANATNVTVRLALVNASGGAERTAELGPQLVEPGANVAYAYAWEAGANLTSGASRLRASLHANETDAPPLAGPFDLPVTVGFREVRSDVRAVRDNRDGTATAEVDVRNTGTVPALFTPRVRFRSLETGAEFDVELAPVLLQPGESRTFEANVALPPGRFSAAVDAREAVGFLAAEADALQVEAPREPVLPELSLAWLPWALAAILTLSLLALAAWAAPRVARRLRRARVVTVPVRGPADDLDRLLARLEAEENPPQGPRSVPVYAPTRPAARAVGPVALFVDPSRIFGVAGDAQTPVGLAELREVAAAGRRVALARAYVTADDEAHAKEAEAQLRRAGYEPVVRVGAAAGHETRVRIALDAAKAAREGCIVVLATHDAALAELAAHLRDEGARCEVAGVEGHVPARLLAAADDVHVLPRAGAARRLNP